MLETGAVNSLILGIIFRLCPNVKPIQSILYIDSVMTYYNSVRPLHQETSLQPAPWIRFWFQLWISARVNCNVNCRAWTGYNYTDSWTSLLTIASAYTGSWASLNVKEMPEGRWMEFNKGKTTNQMVWRTMRIWTRKASDSPQNIACVRSIRESPHNIELCIHRWVIITIIWHWHNCTFSGLFQSLHHSLGLMFLLLAWYRAYLHPHVR